MSQAEANKDKHTHFWVKLADIRAMDPANCKGEYGPIDIFALPPRVKEGPGTVCIGCYQIWGKPPGVLEPTLVKLHSILASY